MWRRIPFGSFVDMYKFSHAFDVLIRVMVMVVTSGQGKPILPAGTYGLQVNYGYDYDWYAQHVLPIFPLCKGGAIYDLAAAPSPHAYWGSISKIIIYVTRFQCEGYAFIFPASMTLKESIVMGQCVWGRVGPMRSNRRAAITSSSIFFPDFKECRNGTVCLLRVKDVVGWLSWDDNHNSWLGTARVAENRYLCPAK